MQRVVVDGYSTEYVSINRGVPQGTVLGLAIFSIFINNIKAVNTDKNLLVKFADDITVSLPIEASVGLDESEREVESFIEWSEKNCMQVNLTKTWELILQGKTTWTPPEPLEIIGRKKNRQSRTACSYFCGREIKNRNGLACNPDKTEEDHLCSCFQSFTLPGID